MRSIPARVFAGFVLVTVAFSGVMGYTLWRMQKVRGQLELINRSYLRLTLLMDKLYISQENLLNIVDQHTAGYQTPKLVKRQVQLALKFRRHQLNRANQVIDAAGALASQIDPPPLLARVSQRLRNVEQRFDRNDPLFDRLFGSRTETETAEVGKELLREEGRLTAKIREIAANLRNDVTDTAVDVELDQKTGLWSGLILVLLAVVVSLAVTFGARRMLRPLPRLVESTKRIGSGDYASRVEVASNNELGLLAREFNNMASAVEERERRLIRSERMATAGMLASHITHEVRNPLNSISLNTEMLEEELSALKNGKASEAKALCQAVQREVDRLTGITEEYLRFARLPKPTLKQEDVNDVLTELLSFVAGELREKKIDVHTDTADTLPPVAADENQLRQAFLNLVRNATDAMVGGGELRISTRHVPGAVEVRITDTGPGISADALGQIFDPFFSTKTGGTGLGLALTHQIIREHGGDIAAESPPGAGATFHISLPAALAKTGESPLNI